MEVPSNMLALGTQAPEFSLPDTTRAMQLVSLADVRGEQGTLVMFICNHCPYVKHIQAGMVALADAYMAQGVGVVAISANDAVNYPQDGPDKMTFEASAAGYHFPYLYDETQAVARVYDAACTPDFYLFDSDLKLVYRGRMDGATPGNHVAVTGNELRAALDALLSGNPVNPQQHPSLGCNVKWAK